MTEIGCFLYHKVTKLKANHNRLPHYDQLPSCCFLYHKVTKLKANHNGSYTFNAWQAAVSYITKLLN